MNKGKKTFYGSTSSDIFFLKPNQCPPVSKFPQFKKNPKFTVTINNEDTCHKNFNKKKIINQTSTFEIENTKTNKRLNHSIDFLDVKRTMNRNGINTFNVKMNDSGVIFPISEKDKMSFDTVYIEPQSCRIEKVKKELLDKGIILHEKKKFHGFKKNDIIPAKTTYCDVKNYARTIKRSKSDINCTSQRHKYIITKNGYGDTNYKNFTKETANTSNSIRSKKNNL